jgi:hypothetical protein
LELGEAEQLGSRRFKALVVSQHLGRDELSRR